MSDEDLIGYLFDLLTPDERAQVAARVQSDPAVAARLDGLRAVAAPLVAVAEVERDEPPLPRPGLAVRAVARVAEYVVEHDPIPPEPSGPSVDAFLAGYDGDGDEPPDIDIVFGPGTRAPVPAAPPPSDGPEFRSGGRFRADLIVAAGIALVGAGLLLSGIAKIRHNSRAAACQNSLAVLYKGLEEHATHDPQGRYPQVGADVPTAGAMATWLTDRGHLPANYKTGCPATADHLAYTYTLGFQTPDGRIIGLRKPAQTAEPVGENDLMPISADLPAADAAPADGPLSPHGRVMNVLFVGGHVRAVTSPLVGPHGDHIYRNRSGVVAAGTDREDAVLGRTGDKP